jgi:uncharacterized membrane protein
MTTTDTFIILDVSAVYRSAYLTTVTHRSSPTTALSLLAEAVVLAVAVFVLVLSVNPYSTISVLGRGSICIRSDK